MADFRDRAGRPVSRADLMTMISEAVLANVLAFDEAGVRREDMKIIVGEDGGNVIGRGAFFQTPVTQRLSEAEGRLLFQTFGTLLEDYDEGRVAPERLARIRANNRVAAKVESIRKSLTE